jgi:hypothetical protein
MKSIASQTSASASTTGLPASNTINAVSASRCPRRMAAARRNTAARSSHGILPHAGAAATAVSTASTMSVGDASALTHTTRSMHPGSTDSSVHAPRRSVPSTSAGTSKPNVCSAASIADDNRARTAARRISATGSFANPLDEGAASAIDACGAATRSSTSRRSR